jgi:thioredoxin-like negative regulator of GroEL
MKFNKKIIILGLLIAAFLFMLFKKYSSMTEHFSANTGRELVLFHMPGCGHCEKLMPTWNLLKTNYGNNKNLDIMSVSSDEKPMMIERYGIKSFPTILLLKHGEQKMKYEGDRSYEDLVRFISYASGQ